MHGVTILGTMADQKFSHLQQERLQYAPPLPKVLSGAYKAHNGDVLKPATDADALQKLFPHTFGKPLVHIDAADVASPVSACASTMLSFTYGCIQKLDLSSYIPTRQQCICAAQHLQD